MADVIPFPVAKVERQCVSCAAWLAPLPEAPDKSMGQCRRFPPTPFIQQVQVGKIMSPGQHPQIVPIVISSWPPAPATGGCLEWRKDGET